MVTETSATLISLSWDPPVESEINGIITEYIIRYFVIEQLGVPDPNDTVLSTRVGGTVNETTLIDLFNYTVYIICINATTIAEGPGVCQRQRTDENGL